MSHTCTVCVYHIHPTRLMIHCKEEECFSFTTVNQKHRKSHFFVVVVSFSSASGVIQRCTQSNKRRTKEEVRSESYVPATDIGALLLRIYSIGIVDNGVLQYKCLDF